MKTVMGIALFLGLIILLSGCATIANLTSDQLASADYGEYPQNYKELVEDYFKNIVLVTCTP